MFVARFLKRIILIESFKVFQYSVIKVRCHLFATACISYQTLLDLSRTFLNFCSIRTITFLRTIAAVSLQINALTGQLLYNIMQVPQSQPINFIFSKVFWLLNIHHNKLCFMCFSTPSFLVLFSHFFLVAIEKRLPTKSGAFHIIHFIRTSIPV